MYGHEERCPEQATATRACESAEIDSDLFDSRGSAYTFRSVPLLKRADPSWLLFFGGRRADYSDLIPTVVELGESALRSAPCLVEPGVLIVPVTVPDVKPFVKSTRRSNVKLPVAP